jgi:hypothetical protein
VHFLPGAVLARAVPVGCFVGTWRAMGTQMSAELLAEAELGRWDWAALREADGNATLIPVALREMLASTSPEEVEPAYWRIENHVVVQGQLYQAAVQVAGVILAALACVDRPRWVRVSLLELLFQIVNGSPHESEVAVGFGDLAEACRAAARQGLWVLYRELLDGERAAAKEILEVVEVESDRLLTVLSRLA